jgi:hypothetical protein
VKTLLNRYSTPLTLGLFAVSTVSGVALFFHLSSGLFHAMHEWLSMVLLVPFGLHVWKNWNPLVGYLRRGALVWPVLACMAVAVPFAARSMMGPPGASPPARAAQALARVPISAMAPALKTSPEALLERLRARGLAAEAGETLEAVAARGKLAPTRLLFDLMG